MNHTQLLEKVPRPVRNVDSGSNELLISAVTRFASQTQLFQMKNGFLAERQLLVKMKNVCHAKPARRRVSSREAKKSFLEFNTPKGFSGPICYEHLGEQCMCVFKVDIGKVLSIKTMYESGSTEYSSLLVKSAGSVLYSLDPNVKKMVLFFENLVENTRKL